MLKPGDILQVVLESDKAFSAEKQAELQARVAEVQRADDDPASLSPQLRELREAMPSSQLCFLEYALDVHGVGSVELVTRGYREKNWRAYLQGHPDHLRTHALERARQLGLAGTEYWQLLRAVWHLDIYHHQTNMRGYLGLYRADVPPGRRAAMGDAELAILNSLPETVTLYRAAPHEQRFGLSWTPSLQIAEDLAEKSFEFYNGGNIYVGQVPRSAILAFYDGQQEAEAVVDVDILRHLVEIEVVKTIPPPPFVSQEDDEAASEAAST